MGDTTMRFDSVTPRIASGSNRCDMGNRDEHSLDGDSVGWRLPGPVHSKETVFGSGRPSASSELVVSNCQSLSRQSQILTPPGPHRHRNSLTYGRTELVSAVA